MNIGNIVKLQSGHVLSSDITPQDVITLCDRIRVDISLLYHGLRFEKNPQDIIRVGQGIQRMEGILKELNQKSNG